MRTKKGTRRLAASWSLCFLITLVMLPALSSSAENNWRRDEAGACVRVWNASQLGRGPVGMVNGVILPFRLFVGGLQGGVSGALLSPFALVAGALEGGGWIGGGLVDLLTGGALAVIPDGIAQIRLEPEQLFPSGHRSWDEYQNHPDCPGEPGEAS